MPSHPLTPSPPHPLTPLPYPYHALHPALTRQVVEWHHTRHHAALVQARGETERALAQVAGAGAANAGRWAELKRRYPSYAAGVSLHDLYWQGMRAGGPRLPTGDLMARLRRDFGSWEGWVEDFVATAGVPESGWALLVHDPTDHRLRNVAVAQHDGAGVPGARVLVACDVWEHAYYLQYGPQRADYVRAMIDLLHWPHIADRLYRSPFGNAQPRTSGPGEHEAIPLPYGYAALRGMSSRTVRWQQEQVYAAHVRARNGIERRLRRVGAGGAAGEFADLKRQELFHAAGQRLFELGWHALGGAGGNPSGELRGALERSFGSLDAWRAELLATALAPRAAWALLVWERDTQRLVNLLVEGETQAALPQGTPLLAVEVRERAYFYDRGPDRAAYLAAFLDNLHWPTVEARFAER